MHTINSGYYIVKFHKLKEKERQELYKKKKKKKQYHKFKILMDIWNCIKMVIFFFLV